MGPQPVEGSRLARTPKQRRKQWCGALWSGERDCTRHDPPRSPSHHQTHSAKITCINFGYRSSCPITDAPFHAL